MTTLNILTPRILLSLLVMSLIKLMTKQTDNKIIAAKLISKARQVKAPKSKAAPKNPNQSLAMNVQILNKRPENPVGGCGFLIIQPILKLLFILFIIRLLIYDVL